MLLSLLVPRNDSSFSNNSNNNDNKSNDPTYNENSGTNNNYKHSIAFKNSYKCNKKRKIFSSNHKNTNNNNK